jgi:hypothetical protein
MLQRCDSRLAVRTLFRKISIRPVMFPPLPRVVRDQTRLKCLALETRLDVGKSKNTNGIPATFAHRHHESAPQCCTPHPLTASFFRFGHFDAARGVLQAFTVHTAPFVLPLPYEVQSVLPININANRAHLPESHV